MYFIQQVPIFFREKMKKGKCVICVILCTQVNTTALTQGKADIQSMRTLVLGNQCQIIRALM